jgi:hypothetical protein
VFLLLAAAAAQAAGISVRSAQLVAGEDSYGVVADFGLEFNSRLEEAINKGVVLYFTTDFELTRGRWYWFDEHVVRRSRTVQLSYHALTRQYRLSTGALHQSYGSLSEALRVLSRVRNWPVFDKSEVHADQTYLAALRLRLDLSLMPKTFQISALANRDWNLTSGWLRWSFTPKDDLPAAPTAAESNDTPTLVPPPAPAAPDQGEAK